MLHDHTLFQDAAIYTEVPDALGISFTTHQLYHGSVADCLSELRTLPVERRRAVFVETVDGMVRLEDGELESVLDQTA